MHTWHEKNNAVFVDVGAWKGLALNAKDIWVLAEVLEVHVEVVVVQPHVESEVQRVLIVQRLVA